jgi:hypothetical protein
MLPLVTGDQAGVFIHGGVPDRFDLFGSCPVANAFDCLGKTANGVLALDYPNDVDGKYYAGIQSQSMNAAGQIVRTMWFGFSYMYVRDEEPTQSTIRFEIAKDVLSWMNNATRDPFTGVSTPPVYRLAQNFPNPFNPSTSITFDMPEKGLVAIRVYNVAGQLVRTLFEGEKDVGTHVVIWDGRNNVGANVVSGVYFYKMETKGFSKTRKMLLLR